MVEIERVDCRRNHIRLRVEIGAIDIEITVDPDGLLPIVLIGVQTYGGIAVVVDNLRGHIDRKGETAILDISVAHHQSASLLVKSHLLPFSVTLSGD